MSIEAVGQVLNDVTEVSGSAKLVLVSLAEAAREHPGYSHPVCWPSQARLAHCAGVGERQIRKILCLLEAKGLIICHKENPLAKGRGDRKPTLYELPTVVASTGQGESVPTHPRYGSGSGTTGPTTTGTLVPLNHKEGNPKERRVRIVRGVGSIGVDKGGVRSQRVSKKVEERDPVDIDVVTTESSFQSGWNSLTPKVAAESAPRKVARPAPKAGGAKPVDREALRQRLAEMMADIGNPITMPRHEAREAL